VACGRLSWGTPVTTPQAGDVVVFDFGFGDRHVTLFESDNGNGTLKCRGGNQSHEVNVTNFPKSAFMGIRHPIVAGAVKPEQAVQQVMPYRGVSLLASRSFRRRGQLPSCW
jgi:hypothetical protein